MSTSKTTTTTTTATTMTSAEKTEIDSKEVAAVGREVPPKLIETWISIAVRVFERMAVKNSSPFFLSVPQIISNLAFLISVCDNENTAGLRREFNPVEKESISAIKTRELVDDTLEFIRAWNSSLRVLAKPGHNLTVRRAICHPKYAKAYTFNTFKTLRRFEVELKIFEGYFEVSNWVAKNLKAGDVHNLSSILHIWPDETLGDQAANSSAVVKKGRSGKANPLAASKNIVETKTNKQAFREMQKPPILAWISHVIVSIHPDIFEGSNIFQIENTECIKIHQSMKTKIELFHVETDCKTLVLPTTNNNLQLVIFYDYGRSQIGVERMREVIKEYRDNAPCLIIPRKSTRRSEAGEESSTEQTTIEELYIPTWNTHEFKYSNLAEHFSACLDMNSIFYTGGFGDLAVPDAEPSASPNSSKIPHIQHFSLLSLVNSPHTSISIDGTMDSGKKSARKDKSSKKSRHRTKSVTSIDKQHKYDYEMVRMPFLVVLWDSHREIPVHLGKICKDSELGVKETEKVAVNPCSIC